MTPQELFAAFVTGFPARKFSAGLLLAFIDLLKALDVPAMGLARFDEMLARYPRRSTTAAGQRANTLIVALPSGKTVSLRPFYNAAERFFRAEHKRFDYPSCAPHATQAWLDYREWLDALCTYDEGEINALRARVVDFVLETLRSQAFDPATVVHEPPLFQMFLDDFDLTARAGEASGAAFQGLVFGFLRADNPHLQVEIDKVRTGSRRLQRVADIDCWEGARLAISAEVKQRALELRDLADLQHFANEIGLRGALGVVAALNFGDGVRDALDGVGVKAVDVADLRRFVEMWDPLKQRTAVASFVYYAQHVEKSASLTERIAQFIKSATPALPGR